MNSTVIVKGRFWTKFVFLLSWNLPMNWCQNLQFQNGATWPIIGPRTSILLKILVFHVCCNVVDVKNVMRLSTFIHNSIFMRAGAHLAESMPKIWWWVSQFIGLNEYEFNSYTVLDQICLFIELESTNELVSKSAISKWCNLTNNWT